MRPWQSRWLLKLWHTKSCYSVGATIHEVITHFPIHPMLLFSKTAFLRNSCFYLVILSLSLFSSSKLIFSVRQNQNKSFKTLQFSMCSWENQKKKKKKDWFVDSVGKKQYKLMFKRQKCLFP